MQNTDRQLDEVQLDQAFVDRLSAKDTNRPQLQACLRHVTKGDTLHVQSIDRLARDLKDLQAIVDNLIERGITVRFHKDGLVFGSEDNSIQKLMLQMMGAFAEFERNLIDERRREGMAIARAKGKPIGRPRKLTPDLVKEVKEALAGGRPKSQVARDFRISRQTLYSLISRE